MIEEEEGETEEEKAENFLAKVAITDQSSIHVYSGSTIHTEVICGKCFNQIPIFFHSIKYVVSNAL